MRISDWSSDVCSSDLAFLRYRGAENSAPGDRHVVARVVAGVDLPRAADLELRVFLLLEPVRDPAGGAGDGEHHREHLGRDAQRLVDDAGVEVDVRVQDRKSVM